jgi:hypothetical protein
VFRNRDGDGHRVYFYAFLGGLALLLEVLMPLPFAALISLSAAVLAAVSLERMEVLLRGFRFGNLFAAVVVVLLLLELHPGPLPVVTSVPREGPPTEYLWLGATDPEAVIVELPAGGEEGMTEVLARRQLYSMYHWRRTVDGAAPRVPALTRSIRGRFRSFPDEASMAQIRALHVDYVLVHTDEYEAAERGRVLGGVMTRKDLVLERTFGETAVYRVE